MNISDLPEDYRELAETRREELGVDPEADSLAAAFDWPDSPEGAYFWIQCHNASDKSDLPPLPKE